jgi:hypothetical protein
MVVLAIVVGSSTQAVLHLDRVALSHRGNHLRQSV